MKIKLNPNLNQDDGIVISPPTIPDLRDKLEVAEFQISKSTVAPCEEIQANWGIQAKQNNVTLSDYQFRLRVHYADINNDIPARGSENFSVYKDTFLSLMAKHVNSGNIWSPIGEPLQITTEGENKIREIPQSLLDNLAFNQINDQIDGIQYLRFRSEIESTWFNNRIEYKLPLEIVINNFFNGDLDITLKLYIRAELDEDNETSLEVSITSDENANFHWLEDIISLGHSATVAKTIEKLLPVIMGYVTRDAERAVLQQVQSFLNIGGFLDDRRLMEVRIIPSGNLGYIQFIFCLRTEESPNFGTSIVSLSGTKAIKVEDQ
ncbi:hypothetical protein SAMN05443144_10276 [Fodinibius roseus]|uniref:Uncharacterized protein n=1 Tax=Fodinibius roseus TaxID=1194090 RepID=A0A1M4UM19_9BACT|nr:hypothetical protein [Fodinibius roseus]SHE57766.1 hypothetical protein SAMN05443144_10276 [Fodinibius roseus]